MASKQVQSANSSAAPNSSTFPLHPCVVEPVESNTPSSPIAQENDVAASQQQSSSVAITVQQEPDQAPVKKSEKPTSFLGSIRSIIKSCVELWKPRLSSLVILTTMGGYYALGGYKHDWKTQASVATGTFLQAACANSINQVMEVELDVIMSRTKHRPLPTKRITRTGAVAQAVLLGATGTALLYKFTNPLTAGLGFANILLYTSVYTPMKTRHWLNTWIGTINGSLPPLMGCTAATNSVAHPTGLYMATSMYLWQITHFMAIAYKCKADYGKAGYQMLSIDQPKSAANQALVHAALFFPLCFSMGPQVFDVAPSWFFPLTVPLNYYYMLKPSILFRKSIIETDKAKQQRRADLEVTGNVSKLRELAKRELQRLSETNNENSLVNQLNGDEKKLVEKACNETLNWIAENASASVEVTEAKSKDFLEKLDKAYDFVNYRTATDLFFGTLKQLTILFTLGMVAFYGTEEKNFQSNFTKYLSNLWSKVTSVFK